MEVIACPFLSGRIPISASLSYHPHLPSISSLSLFTFPFCPFFSLIGNLFHPPLYPHLSVWLLSSGPSSVTCIYPSVTIPPITPLFCMFPRQKPYFIHPTPVSSLSHTLPPSSLSPTTHSRLFFPAALSTRRDVCVYHTLISADTCSTLLSLLFPL